MICGHIHYATIRDEHGIRYMNCGDWVESCTALVEHEDGQFRDHHLDRSAAAGGPRRCRDRPRCVMRILIATDAWHPQVNGVVRTLRDDGGSSASPFGVEISFLTPAVVPHLRDAELSRSCGWRCRARAKPPQLIEQAKPDSIHIATEGPIGFLVRRYCRKHGLPFTTSFHTRFPEYVSARLPDSGILDLGGAALVPRHQPGGDGGDAGAGDRIARAPAFMTWCCGRAGVRHQIVSSARG